MLGQGETFLAEWAQRLMIARAAGLNIKAFDSTTVKFRAAPGRFGHSPHILRDTYSLCKGGSISRDGFGKINGKYSLRGTPKKYCHYVAQSYRYDVGQ